MPALPPPGLEGVLGDDDLTSRHEPAAPMISEAALADRPLVMVAVVAAWVLVGLGTAAVLARRGHELRPVSVLGVVFGPLLIGFYRASLRISEGEADVAVLRDAADLGGSRRVVVAVLGRPESAADAAAVLHPWRESLAEVHLVVPVPYEAADDETDRERKNATALLEQASLFIDDFSPGLALVPGRGVSAIRDHLEYRSADLLIVTGDPGAQAALCRERDLRTVAVAVTSPSI